MRRSVRQKVIAGAAVAVALGGGAFAAVSATGQGDGNRRLHARHAQRLHPQDLTAAAAYLGVSTGQLESELASSGSLARVVQAHPGKSAQGLIDVIVAARKARLAKAVARLPSRVGAEVDAPARLARGGSGEARAGALGAFATRQSLTAVASRYLAVAPSDLRRALHAGKTLAQVADATPGKSSAGLVAALVAARKARLAHALAAGELTRARLARRESQLERHMSALVARKFVRAVKP